MYRYMWGDAAQSEILLFPTPLGHRRSSVAGARPRTRDERWGARVELVGKCQEKRIVLDSILLPC